MAAESITVFTLEAAQGWFVYPFAAVAIGLAWWAWQRYGPTPPGAAGVIARLCRAAALLCFVALLTAPAWRTTTRTILPGHLLVAVDRSASMGRADGPDNGPRIALAAQLYQALAPIAAEKDLRISWASIGSRQGALPTADGLEALEADGGASPLGRDIESIAYANAPDLLVVLSDFRRTEGSTMSALAGRLRELQLAAWTLGVGTDQVDAELRIDEVDGNNTIAAGERQPFTVRMATRALPEGESPITLTVLLGDEVLDQREIEPPESGDPVDPATLEADLEVRLQQEGELELTFRAERGDLRSEMSRLVEVSQRKLRVLLLAHRPRYELRYLREALRRDFTVELDAYLGDGRWRAWSPDAPDELPVSSAALRDYDAIIIGDLAIEQLTPAARAAIAKAVRTQGAGLIWIPGETGNTASFRRDEHLRKLLPVELPDAAAIARGYLADEIIRPRRTDLARRSSLLDAGGTTWADLPDLRGLAPVLEVKRGSQVWLETEDERPIVISRRSGAGTSLLIAIDDTWRWRRNVGDTYLHRFHSQLIRFAAAGRGLGGKTWRVEVSPYRAQPGEPVTLTVVPSAPVDEGEPLPDRVTLRMAEPDGRERLVELERVPDGDSYRSLRPAPGAGSWSLRLIDGLPPAEVVPGELAVVPPAGEMRDPRFNEVAMTDLAQGTGGRSFLDPEELAAALPGLSHEQEFERVEPLWDRWWVIVVLLTVLGIEWSLRRANRLP